MARILIVENHLKDVRIADAAARSVGFTDVEAIASVDSAKKYLQKALEADQPLPEMILVDLDLGADSGFDLLRIRYYNPRLARILVVVWSQLGEESRDVCALFNVDGFVGKWEGNGALHDVLAMLHSKIAVDTNLPTV